MQDLYYFGSNLVRITSMRYSILGQEPFDVSALILDPMEFYRLVAMSQDVRVK